MRPSLWTLGTSSPTHAADAARRAEDAGWDGMAVVDSQNLSGDAYVALAMAASATTTLQLGTGVTNPVTRHPAVAASAAGSVQALSGGRMHLGIGRGDSSLAHLGRAPASVSALERYLVALGRYLRGEEVPFDELDFHERLSPPVASLGLADAPTGSAVVWLPGRRPAVPVEVAATGPKVIEAAARAADRVVLAVGADPDRLAWGVETARAVRPDVPVAAYVNLVCHRDVAVARQLVSGGLATFARFSVMHGTPTGPTSSEQSEVLGRIHGLYDMNHHTQVGSQQTTALTDGFVDRFAIVGPPDACLERIDAIGALGIDRLVLIGPTAGADREQASESMRLLREEVLT